MNEVSELSELYQQIILDHAHAPKNFGHLSNKSHSARGHNPLCGDIVDLDLLIKNDIICDIAFSGDGCAISKASASLMTEKLKGMSLSDAKIMFNNFHVTLTSDESSKDLGKLSALTGVKQFPARVKCATLCWHTFNAALDKKIKSITTE